MEQQLVSSCTESANSSHVDPNEVNCIIDELLASNPKLRRDELFELFRLDITPTGRLARELLLNCRLHINELNEIVIKAIRKECLGDICDEIPNLKLDEYQIKSILREIGALEDEAKRSEYALWLGTSVMNQENPRPENFVLVISHIPALRQIAWNRLISFERVDPTYVADALRFFSGEEAQQKATWFLATWPHQARSLFGHNDMGVLMLVAGHLLTQTNFDDYGIVSLITKGNFKNTSIPQRAIERTLREPQSANASLCAIVDSPLATEAQKEQAAGFLLESNIELSLDTLESIADSSPLYADVANARVQEIIAAKQKNQPRKQSLIDRLIDLDIENKLRVQS